MINERVALLALQTLFKDNVTLLNISLSRTKMELDYCSEIV